METLLPRGHFEMPVVEKIGVVGAMVTINALTIAALVTQDCYPPPNLVTNILLVAISISCFVASGMIIYDEDTS